MATGNPAYDPTISGTSSLTPPATIDGTGLTTTVPLLILNGKNLSGLELQQTGTAATGFIVRDSAGLQRAALGYANSNADWSASSAAGEAVLVGPTTAGKRLVIQGGSTSGVVVLSSTGSASMLVDGLTGAVLGFGGNTLTINGTNATVAGPLAISASTSLTAVALQVAGDPNTGIGAPGGADTIALIAGGTKWAELVSASGTLTFSCHCTWGGGINLAFSGTTGSKIGTAASQKIGFWNNTPVVQPTNAVNLTNNVTSGGTDDTIANYTDLTIYANDAAAIRNDIYQLAKKLKVVNDALRTIGIMS